MLVHPSNSVQVEQITMHDKNAHLYSLDALRGVAILMVVFFHYFYINAAPFNHTNLYPYDDTFAAWGVFQYGILGVPLFFMISGFVIALTLDGCSSPFEFAIRRFARLWPALIVWSIVTFLVLRYSDSSFAESMAPKVVDFFPSWTLTPTALWAQIFPSVRYVDDVYWSLVVEVRLYIFAAVIYWSLNRSNFARNFAIFTFVVIAARLLVVKKFFPGALDVFSMAFVSAELPWFAAGAIFYALYKREMRDPIAIVMLVLLYGIIVRLSIPAENYSRPVMASVVFTFFVVFWALAKRFEIVRMLENRALIFIGTCSYSIYLFHNYIGVNIISLIPKSLNIWVSATLVLGLILLVIAIGYLSFISVERPMRKYVVERLLSKASLGKS